MENDSKVTKRKLNMKLAKAGAVSAVGALKSSTINTLHDVIDKNNDRHFSSINIVSCVWGLMDDYGSQLIGQMKNSTSMITQSMWAV